MLPLLSVCMQSTLRFDLKRKATRSHLPSDHRLIIRCGVELWQFIKRRTYTERFTHPHSYPLPSPIFYSSESLGALWTQSSEQLETTTKQLGDWLLSALIIGWSALMIKSPMMNLWRGRWTSAEKVLFPHPTVYSSVEYYH